MSAERPEQAPRVDRLHVGLIVSCLVLVVTLVGVHESLARQATEEWVAGLEKEQKDLGDLMPLSKQVVELEENPDTSPDQLAEVRARKEEAEKVFARDLLRDHDREQVLKRLAELC
jgi:hypothetical protein